MRLTWKSSCFWAPSNLCEEHADLSDQKSAYVEIQPFAQIMPQLPPAKQTSPIFLVQGVWKVLTSKSGLFQETKTTIQQFLKSDFFQILTTRNSGTVCFFRALTDLKVFALCVFHCIVIFYLLLLTQRQLQSTKEYSKRPLSHHLGPQSLQLGPRVVQALCSTLLSTATQTNWKQTLMDHISLLRLDVHIALGRALGRAFRPCRCIL